MSKEFQGDHIGYQQEHSTISPAHLAATATEEQDIYFAQRACRIKRVDFAPRNTITGQVTNKTTIQATKNGTVQGSAIDYDNGVNTAANTKTNLFNPTTPLAMAAGDRLTVKYTKVGTGLLIPELYFQVVVDFEP